MGVCGQYAYNSVLSSRPYANSANDAIATIIILSNIKMVKTLKQNNKDLYQCEACGYQYEEKEWADKCEAWCNKHHSCNLKITANGIPPSSLHFRL